MYLQFLVVLVLSPIWLTDAHYCEPFEYHLNDECHDHHDNYHRIRHMFEYASSGDNHQTVIYGLIQMYRFAHRCASRGEAAFNIFHPHNIHIDFDVAYDTEYEPTWIRLTNELFDNDPNYPHDGEYLNREMESMVRDHGGPGCLTAILNEFGGLHSREEFFHRYPEVHHTSPRPTTTSTHSPAVITPTHGAFHCNPFAHHLHDPCNPGHQTYQRIRHIFHEASSGHHSPQPVIYHLIQVYRFAHKCATRGEAAFNIFHPQINIESEATWILLTNELFHHDPKYPYSSEQLHGEMEWMMQNHGGPGCLTAILNEFGGSSSRAEFFHHYPEVYPTRPHPTTPSTHTIATTTPTTTPTPTTTMAATTSPTTTAATTTTTTPTPSPTTAATTSLTTTTTATTTTTTTTPTTTPTPTTTTTATTTTSSVTSASTALGHACTVCDTLECLLHVHRRQCAHNEPYCLTTVKDTLQGRTITRSCADSQRCPGGLIMPDARCAKVEESEQEPGTTCHYCCSGHDCNAPPHLFPPHGFVGFGN